MANPGHGEARADVARLRDQIAAMEGRPASFESDGAGSPPAGGSGPQTEDHRAARPGRAGFVSTGADGLDRALGGGIPAAGLTEFHAATARDAGALTGFVMGLLALSGLAGRGPVLWIDAGSVSSETGLPYRFGPGPADGATMLLALPRRLPDALWICEEAAATAGLGAVVLAVQGRPALLGLKETQRLSMRGRGAGRPLFLLQVSGETGASAAALRLLVEPALSAPRFVLSGSAAARAVPGGIGPPGFAVTIDKNKAGAAGSRHTLFWNRHDRRFDASLPASGVPAGAIARSPAARRG